MRSLQALMVTRVYTPPITFTNENMIDLHHIVFFILNLIYVSEFIDNISVPSHFSFSVYLHYIIYRFKRNEIGFFKIEKNIHSFLSFALPLCICNQLRCEL